MRRMLAKSLLAVSFTLLMLPGVSRALPYSSMYLLGDSLSDVGNLFIATDGLLPTPLPQDPPYFEGRFSNGPNYAEHLWQRLGLPGELAPAFAGGTDYAIGGARTRYHTFDRADPGFDPRTDPSAFPQFTLLGQSEALLTASGGMLAPEALYTVWIGANDVADAFELLLLGGTPDQASDLLLQSAGDTLAVVSALVDAGARALLVPNVPNLGLTPEVQVLLPSFPGAQALATGLAQTFNGMVDAGLAGITADIIRLDTFRFLTQVVADPERFGLPVGTNVSEPCFSGFVGVPGSVCSDSERYVFWDQIHPSAVTHSVLGYIAAVAVVPEPGILLLLATGLAAIGWQRRSSRAG